MITSYATPKFPSSKCSYDMQIWPLPIAPRLTKLFDPPCKDPSTLPHIQESDVLVSCRLNILFKMHLESEIVLEGICVYRVIQKER